MQTDWRGLMKQEIDRAFDEFVAIRRYLHSNPEPSAEEKETSFLLYTKLNDLGLDARLGPDGFGVIADLRSDSANSMIALRADIDALRIHDEKDVSYRSQCDGVMHACGHDVHTAIVYGALFVLKRLADQKVLPVPISVRGLFQPAEEICRGAKQLIELDCMDQVSAIFATHVDPSLTVGKIGLRDGVLTASCDEIHLTINGHGSHAARPHQSRDPISAAADLIHAMYMHIPRRTDSQEAVVVSIGKVAGGDNFNVIPEEVSLYGTLRTLDPAVRNQTIDHLQRIADGVGATSQTEIKLTLGLSAPSVVNNSLLVKRMHDCCSRLFGEDAIHDIARPSMGSEDFAFYLDYAPGMMVRLGCRSEQVGSHGLHTSMFDVDEEVIRIGTQLLVATLIETRQAEIEN